MKRYIILVMIGIMIMQTGARAHDGGAQYAHWSHVDIRVVVAIPPSPRRTLALASLADWQRALPTARLTIDPRADLPCRMQRGTITICTGALARKHMLGWTRARQHGHRIIGIKTTITNAPIRTREVRQTFCHELGHAFGLRHDDHAPASTCVSDASDRLWPGAHDISTILSHKPFIP